MELIHAIRALAASANARSEQPRRSRLKVRDPDTFNGQDTSKLRPFLAQLGMVFSSRPEDFPDDESKILYTISFLTGPAFKWFEAEIIGTEDDTVVLWSTDFDAFIVELATKFGSDDNIREAEEAIGRLTMKPTDRLRYYSVKFNDYASRLTWNDPALRRAFYIGLPDRLKDDIAREDDAPTLAELRKQCMRLDNRYWARENEKRSRNSESRSSQSSNNNKPSGSSSSNTTNNNNNRSISSGDRNSSNRNNSGRFQSTSTTTSTSTSTLDKAGSKPAKPHAKLLGPDGKLLPAERERRKKNGLCMFCGKPGHESANCNAKSSKPINGRFASAQDASATISEVSPESGKD
jgi:hypothetical protein